MSIDAVLIDREGGPAASEAGRALRGPLMLVDPIDLDAALDAATSPTSSALASPSVPSPPALAASASGSRRMARAGKRVVDLVVAVPALVVLAPLLLMLALLVRVTSRGPALFRQERVGRGGQVFTLYKLRTMYLDAEERLVREPELGARYRSNGFKLPIDEDPRVTRVGRFLRRTSLDELPQLLNVVAGDMSLVGPRPVLAMELTSLYGDRAPLYGRVKPGMTGLWQVSGRSHVTHAARAELDVAYVCSWSVAGDLGLLLRTVPAVLRGVGAH